LFLKINVKAKSQKKMIKKVIKKKKKRTIHPSQKNQKNQDINALKSGLLLSLL